MRSDRGLFQRVWGRILESFSGSSIYNKLSLLIMTAMLFLSLFIGWQSAQTIWDNSRFEHAALADNLLRLSLQKIESEHKQLIQYKHMQVVRQRKILEESMGTLLPLLRGLAVRVRQGELSAVRAKTLALSLLRQYPNTSDHLFLVYHMNLTPFFLAPDSIEAAELQRARTFIGQPALQAAKAGCQEKGYEFLTLQYTGKNGETRTYAAFFSFFRPWGWLIGKLNNTNNIKEQIAIRSRTYYSRLTSFLASIPTRHGQLVLLKRNSDEILFPKDLDTELGSALLRLSLPLYGIHKAKSAFFKSLPAVGSCEVYSRTYPGFDLQILYLSPLKHLTNASINLILKQIAIIFSLFVVSVMAITLLLKRFTRPLLELTNFAKKLSSTDCILPPDSLQRLEQLSQRSPDETTRLAQSFLLLQKALSERIIALKKASYENEAIAGKLQRLNKELDIRVRERTQQLEQANEELRIQEKKKTDFLSAVSHELRTPMTAIAGFITMIRTRIEEKLHPLLRHEQDKANPHLKRIERDLEIVSVECERLSSLIDTVLDISKIESGNMQLRRELFDPVATIKHAVRTVSVLYEQAGIPLKLDIPEKLPMLTGDKDRIIQVIINLLSNALKFTNTGSVGCRARRQRNNLVIQITDTGIGIPVDKLKSIFGKFIQLDDHWNFRLKGTGLGLAICKTIIEAHDGTIQATSVENKGSTFSVTLPLASRSAPRPPLSGDVLSGAP